MPTFPLLSIESKLRALLPADLYAALWLDPSSEMMVAVIGHLRALQRILTDYLPPDIIQTAEQNYCETNWDVVEGTLMFTDLAGFTPLLEANARAGRAGARALLKTMNDYFAGMIEIISLSGGTLLEFTGDAMLVYFQHDGLNRDPINKAIRAGLRMQRAMKNLGRIETEQGTLSLGMRIGIHTGTYLRANIGTPMRMDHVLLGRHVRLTKKAEGAGVVGRICLTDAAYRQAQDQFRFDPHQDGHQLVIDDFSDGDLGEYEITALRPRRQPRIVVLDRSLPVLVATIEQAVATLDPLSSYLPAQILNLVVENTARREVAPVFAAPTILFLNLIGLSESADPALPPDENEKVVAMYTRVFALVNAAVRARGGVLKKVTYHMSGSDTMILFGVPSGHTDDPRRAADAALAIRAIIQSLPPLEIAGQAITVGCKMGMASGPVFAAEVGSPRGRREYNVLGDTVNTAARFMAAAEPGQILMTDATREAVEGHFRWEALGERAFKGKSGKLPVFCLLAAVE